MQPVLRSPPAFEMDTGGDLFWRVPVSAIAAATAAVLLAWLCSHLEADLDAAPTSQLLWHAALLALLLLTLACWEAWCASIPVALTLRWDSRAWLLLGQQLAEPMAGPVQVVADPGDWLILRLRPNRAGLPRPCYLRLSCGDAAGRCWAMVCVARGFVHGPAAPWSTRVRADAASCLATLRQFLFGFRSETA